MEKCDFRGECFFVNEIMIARPLTTGYARAAYCDGDFAACTIYKVAKAHGIDKVPRYVSPEDSYEFNDRVVVHDTSNW